MILHPVAVASDVDDMAVVHKAVDESRRHHLVAQHAAPVLETLVRRQHSRRLLVARVDELEEEHGAVLVDRQVADLVDHQQSRMGEHAQEKLDAPDLVLVWDELRASDLAGRARAFQSMIGGGMDVAKAAALAGLTEPE